MAASTLLSNTNRYRSQMTISPSESEYKAGESSSKCEHSGKKTLMRKGVDIGDLLTQTRFSSAIRVSKDKPIYEEL